MKIALMKGALRKIISDGCIFYTILTLLLYTGGMLASTREREWIPTLGMLFTVLLFSVLFAAANYSVSHTKLTGALKLLFHYGVTALIFYVLFILWGGFSSSPATVLILMLAFTLVYAIAALLVFLVRYVSGGAKNKQTKYESQFGPKK